MNTQNNEIIGLPFVNHVEQDKRPILNNANEFIKKVYSNPFHFGIDNIKKTGYYKLMGYQYNLKPYLKKYLFKQYDNWCEIYAPNKTSLRKITIGKIDKIIKIKTQ